MKDKHIIIIGAGPGGLTCGMFLSHKGYNVSIFEKEHAVGGRNSALKLGNYTFDTGPTFLMMDFVLKEMFSNVGADIHKYLDLKMLDPMYTLSFTDKEIPVYHNPDAMRQQIAKYFPNDEKGFLKFNTHEKKRYELMYPCLKKDYSSVSRLLEPDILKALPYLSLGKSLYQNLGTYFSHEHLKISFTFQAKYLGMSPWDCPALFTIIPYIEHAFGVYHTTGGLSKISDAMAQVVQEKGGQIKLGTKIKKILVKNKKAIGVECEDGTQCMADAIVINADFGYAATNLFEPGILKKYTKKKLLQKKFSCSTFMMYLGLDKCYQEPHHKILFAQDYKANISDIVKSSHPSDDMSIYIRNASINDPTLAPKNHSAVYVLVPVPNRKKEYPWSDSQTEHYRNKIVEQIKKRTAFTDIESHIKEEKIITPRHWESEHNLFLGSTFNLGHNLSQMLYLRPRNRFEEIKNCYLVGGGTHPGSGLPTIYESGRISARLVETDVGSTG